jgi:uncharacterized protein YjbJ (UPF0337 family)
MNEDQFKGQWQQLKGKVKASWGKLTDDDLLEIDGRKDQLAGKIQERYGITKEEANRKLDEFAKKHATVSSKPLGKHERGEGST